MTEERTGSMNRKPKVTIRQMEIDDIPSVYHLGERVFTSEDLPILYRTWDPYEVTEYFSSDPDYCFIAEIYVCSSGLAEKPYGSISHRDLYERGGETNVRSRIPSCGKAL